jgi:hypothetical protein
MLCFLTKNDGWKPVKLFEFTRSQMGPHMAKPALADTLIQTPERFLPHLNLQRQGVITIYYRIDLKIAR